MSVAPPENIRYDSDNYNLFDFRDCDWDGYENDDLNDFSDDVFKIFQEADINAKWEDNQNPNREFHKIFKDELSPNGSEPELEDALDDLYDFLNDDVNMMQSAQCDLTSYELEYDGEDPTEFKIEWESRSYDDAEVNDDFTKYGFDQGYGDATYDNTEFGFRLYYWDEATDDWVLITTKDNDEFTHSIPCGADPDPCVEEVEYKLTSYNSAGNSLESNTFLSPGESGGYGMDVSSETELNFFEYLKCAPNPFGNKTKIRYKALEESRVKIEVFDANLDRVDVLVDEYKAKGEYSVSFEPNNIGLPQGIYFARITSFSDSGVFFSKVIKLVYVK